MTSKPTIAASTGKRDPIVRNNDHIRAKRQAEEFQCWSSLAKIHSHSAEIFATYGKQRTDNCLDYAVRV